MINVVKNDLNHHNCFLSFSFPCFILSFLSSPFPFHASSFHSFPHLVEGQRCVSPVPDTSVLHLFIPFLTFSFPCFIPSFLSPIFLSMLHPTIPFLPFLSLMKHHPQIFFVVVRFGSVSDLADLRTKAVLVTAASSGLIHVTGGLCLSSSSFEMRPSPR